MFSSTSSSSGVSLSLLVLISCIAARDEMTRVNAGGATDFGVDDSLPLLVELSSHISGSEDKKLYFIIYIVFHAAHPTCFLKTG